MRRSCTLAVLVTALVFLLGASSAGAKSVPVAPGTAKVRQFEGVNGCGCHAALIEQWRLSMHSQALGDPLYQTKLAEAQAATDGKIGAFCNKCHGPVATMTKTIDRKDFGGAGTASSESIACTFCHQATGLAGKPANTSHVVSADGIRRAQIKDPLAPHPAVYSEFHTSSEICGGCHNVDHPINGMHLESTYSEWKASPYAKEGVTCQDCHMSREAGSRGPFTGTAAGGAPERDIIYSMSFVGAQVELGDAVQATAMLESAAEVTLEVPEIIPAGERAEAIVVVENKGAGHYLPTGLTEVREMWLEVVAISADGTEEKLGERKFGTILKDAKGKYPVELWEAVAIQSDDRIPPRQSIEERYEFSLPDGSEAATVTARLKYRSAPEEFAKKAGVENPVTVMAAATQRVFASEKAKAASNDPAGESQSGTWSIVAIAVAVLAVVGGLILFFVRRNRTTA